jgi:hypothetical protein
MDLSDAVAGQHGQQLFDVAGLSPLRSVRGVGVRQTEHRLRRARSVREIYATGLWSLCRFCGGEHSGLLTVDAECLDWPTGVAGTTRSGRDALPAWSDAVPLPLDAQTAEMIKADLPAPGIDPVAQLVAHAFGVSDPVVGRVRLHGSVIALLITSSMPTTSAAPARPPIIEDIAALMSARLERVVDAVVSPSAPGRM